MRALVWGILSGHGMRFQFQDRDSLGVAWIQQLGIKSIIYLDTITLALNLAQSLGNLLCGKHICKFTIEASNRNLLNSFRINSSLSKGSCGILDKHNTPLIDFWIILMSPIQSQPDRPISKIPIHNPEISGHSYSG